MSTSEEGVRERGDSALVGRDNRSERVGVETQARTIGAAEVSCYSDPTGNVHASGTVPTARIPAGGGTQCCELIAAKQLRLGCFLRDSG